MDFGKPLELVTAATNSNILHLFFFFLFIVIARLALGPDSGVTDFIRSCCCTTLYPDVCFISLSAYANTVQLDPICLASAATNLTVTQVQSVLFHVKDFNRESMTSSESAALKDCKESLDDEANLVQQSAGEMAQLGTVAGEEIGWHVSNAQTWLSAAMTNEDTCTEVMEEVDDGPMKAYLSESVWLAKQFTSIALALVNHLANSLISVS